MKWTYISAIVLIIAGLVVAGCRSSAPAVSDDVPAFTGGPRLHFEQAALDYGKIPLNKVVEVRYDFRNVGDEPLIVQTPQATAVEGC